MTEVLSLLAGMALGVLVCALLVGVIALIWREQWRAALVYFGLAEERDATDGADSTAERGFTVRGRSLFHTGAFEWPRTGGRASGHRLHEDIPSRR
jgi:hypothetical protein